MAAQTIQNSNPELRSRVGPSHAAIVLTDASNPHSPSPPVPDFLNSSSGPDWAELGPFRFITRQVEDLSSTDEDLSYVSSPLPLPSPRPPAQWRLASRFVTQASPNEPSTSLGRRVAARQAGDAAPMGPRRAFHSVSVADLMRAARRRQVEARAGTAGTVLPPERTDYINSTALVRARDSRMRAEARTISSRSSPRTPRPDDLDAEQVDSRSYRVRRRLNADGDELVYSVSVNTDSPRFEDPTWDVPQRRPLPNLGFPLADPEDTAVPIATQRLPSDNSVTIEDNNLPPLPTVRRRLSSRRRGWARLDADGNEIPTEEEDALERARAQVRIREQDQTHPALTMFQMVRDRMATDRNEENREFVPTTQSPEPEHSSSQPPHVRVYINSIGMLVRDVTSAGIPITDVIMPDETDIPQLCSPYQTNPLPMPLEDMIDSRYSKRPRTRVNDAKSLKVSRFAQFAGR